jgi:hypothetical protein
MLRCAWQGCYGSAQTKNSPLPFLLRLFNERATTLSEIEKQSAGTAEQVTSQVARDLPSLTVKGKPESEWKIRCLVRWRRPATGRTSENAIMKGKKSSRDFRRMTRQVIKPLLACLIKVVVPTLEFYGESRPRLC